MSRDVNAGADAVWGIVSLVGSDGAMANGVLAADVQVSYQIEGAATVGPLDLADSANPAWAESRWLELGGGDYRVGLPLSLVDAANAGKAIRIFGAYSGGDLHGETLRVAAATSSTLSGPFGLLITVTDAETEQPIEGCRVRVKKNSDQESEETDELGQWEPNVDDGLWTVRFRRWGYDSLTTTKTVSGADATLDVALTPWVIEPPETPDNITGVLLCLQDDDETPAEGVVVTVEITQPSTLPGIGYDGVTVRTRTSGSNGLVQFPHAKGAVYRHRVGNGAWMPYRAPSTGTSFNMAEAVSG